MKVSGVFYFFLFPFLFLTTLGVMQRYKVKNRFIIGIKTTSNDHLLTSISSNLLATFANCEIPRRKHKSDQTTKSGPILDCKDVPSKNGIIIEKNK